MARRLVVSDGVRAQECQPLKYKVAVGGVVKLITKAACVENGIVRQFWPPSPGAGDPRIKWGTTLLPVIESVADPLDSTAIITFTRATGLYSYSNYPNANIIGTYLSPVLDGTAGDDDKYLIRVDQTGGTALTGTLATWIDINSLATHIWSLDQTIVGALSATANISIAADNGAGSPTTGTIVVRAVTFSSTVTATSDIVWTEDPYALVEIKQSVDATCDLILNPDGFAVGDADTSGSFNEAWHSESPNATLADTLIDRFGNIILDRFGNIIVTRSIDLFTVQVDLISGTAPTGSSLAVALPLDQVRQWTLTAISGEDLDCALDVTVSDGTTAVVKRITMNSERIEAATSNVWTTDDWSLTDLAESTAPGALIAVDEDGHADGIIFTGVSIEETETWHDEALTPSDPENYEVLLNVVAGIAGLVTGPAQDVYHNLASQQAWQMTHNAGNWQQWVVDVYIRRIGDLPVIKRVFIELGVEPDL
jgi:hypothetical protein